VTEDDDPLRDEVHLKVMNLLTRHPEFSQRELAQEVGVSLGKINYCMRALIGKGFLKVNNFRRSSNKLGYAYLLTPSGLEAKARLTKAFLQLKQREYHALREEIRRLQGEVDAAGG